jgi:hypothetical protein
MTVLLPITPPVKTACDALEAFIGDFIAAWRTFPPPGKYEAEVEAHNLFKLVIRNAEGILELARHDLILLPPALAAARACFETAVKASWLVNPENPFDREARYLIHLKAEERSIRRTERISDMAFQRQLLERERSIREFRVGVEKAMPKHVKLLPGTPWWRIDLQRWQGLADRLRSDLRENALQCLNARRERIAIGIYGVSQ